MLIVVRKSCYSGYKKCEHYCIEVAAGRGECKCKEYFKLNRDGKSCKGKNYIFKNYLNNIYGYIYPKIKLIVHQECLRKLNNYMCENHKEEQLERNIQERKKKKEKVDK